jgi:hypothetical protein
MPATDEPECRRPAAKPGKTTNKEAQAMTTTDSKLTAALLDIIAGRNPGRAGRHAQDCGLCDYNRWDGWMISPQGLLWLERSGNSLRKSAS